MTSARRRRQPVLPARGLIAALVVAGVSLIVLIAVRPRHNSHHAKVATSATSTTVRTTTTVDPGSLPQTNVEPVATDPAEQARAKALFDAIVADDPTVALPAFFPRGAYLQVKSLANPGNDYDTRLIPQFTGDIHTLHARVVATGTTATPVFSRLDVVNTPVLVQPGVEHNSGIYWRVYDSVLRYTVNGVPKTLPVKSMISWRGQWYVVHLIVIK